MAADNIFANELMRNILNRLYTNIFVTDAETDEIIYMNDVMKETFGLEHPEGHPCWQVLQKDMKARCGFCRIGELLGEKDRKLCIWDEKNVLSGRVYRNYDSLIELGGKTYHIQNSMDITNRMTFSDTANIDELTELWNRRAGKEKLRQLLEQAKKEKKTTVVALFDINELKAVNDRFGHLEGDRFLRYAATAVREVLREKDLALRLSGDEFVVAFYAESSEEADANMRRIQDGLKEMEKQYGLSYRMGFSYGLMEVYPEDSYTVTQIIAKADSQMYIQKRRYHIEQAKQRLQDIDYGRDTVFQYDKDHLYTALTASTDDYIFVGNMKTGVFMYPPAMVREFGLPGPVLENAAAFWGELIHPHDESRFLESNQEIADGRTEYHNIEYRARNVRGEWIWLRCRGKMVRDVQGMPELFAGFITNLGRREQIDHMTGLYNRFKFEGAVKKHLVSRTVSHMGIMILDMDTFKDINDLYNRSFGDEILRMTAEKIRSVLPENASAYRLDGDEFGIVLLNGEKKAYDKLYTDIQEELERQKEWNGRKYHCTVSAGYAVYPEDADNYLDLIKYSDYALEESKRQGKNRLTVFTRDIIFERTRRLKLTELLRECVGRGFAGFDVYYQPQVESATGRLYGAEALARWNCPDHGNISPVEFIPLLEKSGLIVEFGRWVFRQAVLQCREWRKRCPDFNISINLSYVQVIQDDVVGFVESVLSETGLKPQAVTLELTESYLAKEDKLVKDCMESLKDQGLLIAMDDFGSGYSSLKSLKTIPANIVKIDREFTAGITSDAFNMSFIRAITELCHKVGKTVCLEGVETEEEYRMVSGSGLELIQGYYFGKPVKAEEFPIA